MKTRALVMLAAFCLAGASSLFAHDISETPETITPDPDADLVGMYDDQLTTNSHMTLAEFADALLVARMPKVRAALWLSQNVSRNVHTPINFNATHYEDIASMHDTAINPSRLVAPLKGIYRVTLHAHFVSSSTSTNFLMYIRPSNSTIDYAQVPMPLFAYTASHLATTTEEIPLDEGDYVEGVVWQDVASTLVLSYARMSMQRIGPYDTLTLP